MNEQIAFLYQEIESLKQKKLDKRITSDDIIYLELIEKTLLFIKGNLLQQVYAEIANNNMTAIREYQKYLDSEVQKYTNRIELLMNELAKQSYTKKIDEKIKKCKTKLDVALQKREEFNRSYVTISSEITPEPISQSLKRLFDSPVAGTDILASTRFASNINDFLMQDKETGEIKLNKSNVYLFLEVFKDHKSENLRKLVQIKELEQNENISSKDTQMQLESLKASLPESFRQANIHVFDRFCHYSALPYFSNLKSEEITDKLCYGNEEIIAPTIKRLRIALILDSANHFNRQDLISMIGEENLMLHEDSMKEQISEMTNRSL